MKKYLSVLLIALTLIAAMSVSVNAENVLDAAELHRYLSGYSAEDLAQYVNGSVTLEEYFKAEIADLDYTYSASANFDKAIDVSAYNVPVEQRNEIFNGIILNNPELFYIKIYNYTSIGNYIADVNVKYVASASEVESMLSDFNAAVAAATASVDDNMSDFEKALIVHDYLILNCEYDTTYQNYDAYDALVTKKAVCEGYALAYMHILRTLDIDCEMVTSEPMIHAWNAVKIDGEWYHVDVTHDDPLNAAPIYDVEGRVRHNNFLFSDSNPGEHNGWESERTMSSTKYDNAYFKSVDSAFEYIDGNWYYFAGDTDDYLNHTLYRDSDPENADGRTEEKSVSAVFFVDSHTGGSYWQSHPYIWKYNGGLIYNKGTELCFYNIHSNTETTLASTDNGHIYSFAVSGNTLIYYVGSGNPITLGEKQTVDLAAKNLSVTHNYSLAYTTDIPATVFATGIKSKHCSDCEARTDITVVPKQQVIYGDVTSDGEVNVLDMILLKKHLTSACLGEAQLLAADFNNDSRITEDDLKSLQQSIIE